MRAKHKRTGRIEYFTLDQWKNLEETSHSNNFVVLDGHEISEKKVDPIKIESFIEPQESLIDPEFEKMTKTELQEYAENHNIELESTLKAEIINELREKHE